MLNIIASNRYELLRAAWLAHSESQQLDPLRPETVIVPNWAVRRDLQLALAGRQGVALGCQTHFWREWTRSLLLRLGLPTEPSDDELYWQCQIALAAGGWQGTALEPYLSQTDDFGRSTFADSQATRFRHYLGYRPEWLTSWQRQQRVEGGDVAFREHESWQAELWRRIVRQLGVGEVKPDLLRLAEAALTLAQQGFLPQRLTLFCELPTQPLAQHCLVALARVCEVDAYWLNPAPAMWDEAIASDETLADDEHPLLRQWAKPARRFWQSWNERQAEVAITQQSLVLPFDGSTQVVFPSPHLVAAQTQPSLLVQLQNQIAGLALANAKLVVREGDDSLVISACHHLRRQVEVLELQLLALLARPEAPPLDQIVVVCPQLSLAAPYFDAVWGGHGQIPFQLTGVAHNRQSPLCEAFLRLLGGVVAPLSPNSLFDLLRLPPLVLRWGYDLADVDRLQQRLIDQQRLSMHSLSADWQRLRASFWLSFAVGETRTELAEFAGSSSMGSLTTPLTTVTCALFSTLDWLDDWRQRASHGLPVAAWVDFATTLLDEMVDGRDEAVALAQLRRGVTALGEAMRPLASWSAASYLAAWQRWLDGEIPAAVPSGVVTITSMAGLRYRPAMVLAVIGLDVDAFPNPQAPDPLDLLRRLPRAGDVQRLHEEQQLFCDLLMAARQRLLLFYNGFDPRDQHALLPSQLIGDLNRYLHQHADAWPGVIKRRLQPHLPDPDLNVVGRLAEADRVDTARAIKKSPVFDRKDTGLIPRRTLSEQNEPELMSVDYIARYANDPLRYWLRSRFRLRLVDDWGDWPTGLALCPHPHYLRARLRHWLENRAGDVVDEALLAADTLPSGLLADEARRAETNWIENYRRLQEPSGETIDYAGWTLMANTQLGLYVPAERLSTTGARRCLPQTPSASRELPVWVLLSHWLAHLCRNASLDRLSRSVDDPARTTSLILLPLRWPAASSSAEVEPSFIHWSGCASGKATELLADWLEYVNQRKSDDLPPVMPLATAWARQQSGHDAALRRWFGDAEAKIAAESTKIGWQLGSRHYPELAAMICTETGWTALAPLVNKLLAPIDEHKITVA